MNMSIAEALGRLNWDANGGKSFDEGRGTCLRNWECTSGRNVADVVLAWDALPPSTLALDVYLGWKQFPIGRCTLGNREFDPAYLAAMYEGKLGQAARVRVTPAPGDRCVTDRVAENGPIDWYYAKLVAVLPDGVFADVRGWSLGSMNYRASGNQPFPSRPAAGAESYRRPPGHREWRTQWEPLGTTPKPG